MRLSIRLFFNYVYACGSIIICCSIAVIIRRYNETRASYDQSHPQMNTKRRATIKWRVRFLGHPNGYSCKKTLENRPSILGFVAHCNNHMDHRATGQISKSSETVPVVCQRHLPGLLKSQSAYYNNEYLSRLQLQILCLHILFNNPWPPSGMPPGHRWAPTSWRPQTLRRHRACRCGGTNPPPPEGPGCTESLTTKASSMTGPPHASADAQRAP